MTGGGAGTSSEATDLARRLRMVGRAAGLDAVGVASAEPFVEARATLESRAQAGLAAGMQFTYRNPARSTDPGRALPGARSLVVGALGYERAYPGAAGSTAAPGRRAAPQPLTESDHRLAPGGPGGRAAAQPPTESDHRLAPGGPGGRAAAQPLTESDHPLAPGGPGGRAAAQPPTESDHPLAPGGPGDISTVPARVARYSWVDHYAELRAGLRAMAEELRGHGWRALVLADDNALVDRAAAQRAGIGWYGKNTNILIPGAGSWFVLGSVLTDAVLTPDEPVGDGCGSCQRCMPACPTGALVAPGVLDARRCLAWLVQAPGVFPLEYRVALGDRIYGCDDCQEVCPVNRLHTRRQPPAPAAPDAEAAVDALGLLAADDDTLTARFGRWYLAGRQVRWLRRNALLVLGNTADPSQPEVVSALGAALGDPDPAVRGPAVWAAARLGLSGMLPAADKDPDVTAELAAAPTVEARFSA